MRRNRTNKIIDRVGFIIEVFIMVILIVLAILSIANQPVDVVPQAILGCFILTLAIDFLFERWLQNLPSSEAPK